MQKIHVIIVDDHDVVRRGIRMILSDEPEFEIVQECSGAAELLALIRSGLTADIVLLDINMPGTSGLEVIQPIKALLPGVKILVVSMYPENQYALRAIHLDADGYLNKAEAGDRLIPAIKTVLSGEVYVNEKTARIILTQLKANVQREPHQLLSDREFEIMMHIVSGKERSEIASSLFISEKTVTTHRALILEKLRVRNDVELTHYAVSHNLLPARN
jgi:DNA-binding NarL/FixJ family response regulator